MSYGDIKAARRHCFFPAFRVPGEWQHGWNPEFFNELSEMIVGGSGLSKHQKRKTYFVAREDQKEALNRDGYENVYAIGLPLIYVNKKKSKRKKGSLLIMPDHTLDERSDPAKDHEYYEYISKFKHHFSSITLCVHRSCFDQKRWNKLSGIADTITVGAHHKDNKTLEKMSDLMTAHEFMTTNEFGSHVPYAAFFGCKVSVGGPKQDFHLEELVKSPFFRNCPASLEMFGRINREDTYAKTFPFLAVEPQAAERNEAWAGWELGLQCKKTPAELRKTFGWHYYALPVAMAKLCYRAARRCVRYILLHLNFLRFFGRSGVRVFSLLRDARHETTQYTELPVNPRPLKIRNRSSDIDVVVQHFGRRELLDIKYPKKVKTILDLGANIGVSVVAFRSMFPGAQIIAVEMNTENFNLLKENCSNDPLTKLENAAIWSEDGSICQVDVGAGDWGLRVGDHPGKSLGEVPSFTFSTILRKHDVDCVDICKMDIEGAEADVLTANWKEIFSRTKVLILEIHPWIPNVAESVHTVIEDAEKAFNLNITHSGEFKIISNIDL